MALELDIRRDVRGREARAGEAVNPPDDYGKLANPGRGAVLWWWSVVRVLSESSRFHKMDN